MDYRIREMTIDDYDEVRCLWEQTEGLCFEEGDSREAIAIYLKRNQGLCFVACAEGRVIAGGGDHLRQQPLEPGRLVRLLGSRRPAGLRPPREDREGGVRLVEADPNGAGSPRRIGGRINR